MGIKRMDTSSYIQNQCNRLKECRAKDYLVYAIYFDSLDKALESLRKNNVLRYALKQKVGRMEAKVVFDECKKVVFCYRMLRTVHFDIRNNPKNRKIRVQFESPILLSGVEIDFNDFSHTLKLKSGISPTTEEGGIKATMRLLADSFEKYIINLKSQCTMERYELIARELAEDSIVGGESSLDEYFDDLILVELDNQLKNAQNADQQRDLLLQKKRIYEKHAGLNDLLGRDAPLFLETYARFNEEYELSRPFRKKNSINTKYFVINSWKSIKSMLDALSSHSALTISYHGSVWEEMGNNEVFDYSTFIKVLTDTVLMIKVFLTADICRSTNNKYTFTFSNFPETKDQWEYAFNARFEIASSKESCHLYTNKLKYNYDENTFSRISIGFPDEEYLDSILEALSSTIDFALTWLEGRDSFSETLFRLKGLAL